MYSSTIEAVTHLSYGSEPPSVFELADDLLDPRTACGAPVRIRKGNETYRITRINMFSGTGELARAVSAGLEEPTRPVNVIRQGRPASSCTG